ncbi:type II toxin-antitoxin system RelE/ParE family toxin [Leptospira kobayashii]|uniref:type II toxin-antitoxin system RelE/ParE family toxin n=1 Tax=Leptospira kobayashii TaxID=1917830 RepID=UPI000D58ECD6|nr:type II toxin-antitoxin system RelE/ParE family toxin [Leptospira kobayashii]
MIKSFLHKGLEDFFNTGSKKGIRPDHSSKLARILDRLDASLKPEDMDLPGYKLHPLKGDKKKRWSVSVNGNWRVTFLFVGKDAILVDYEDYH